MRADRETSRLLREGSSSAAATSSLYDGGDDTDHGAHSEAAPILVKANNSNTAMSSADNAQSFGTASGGFYAPSAGSGDYYALSDADVDPEHLRQFDLVVSMRQVDVIRGPVKGIPALDLFMSWCAFCGVLPSAALFHPTSGTLDLRSLMILSYRAFLWLALVFMTLVDIVHAVSREGPSAWTAVSIAVFMFLACAASFGLARDVLRRQVIQTRVTQVLTNSGDPELSRSYLSARFYFSLGFAVLVTALGVVADVLDSSAFLQDSSSPLSLRLGPGGILLYRVASFFVQLQVTVGITVISALLSVFQVRVLSAARALTVEEETTSVEQAIRRLIDLDITVSHAAHKYARDMAIVLLSFILKFFLSAVYQVRHITTIYTVFALRIMLLVLSRLLVQVLVPNLHISHHKSFFSSFLLYSSCDASLSSLR